MGSFTPRLGRYLSFIEAYTAVHRYAPAEWEIAAALCVSPPSVHQMVLRFERLGLISRQPGVGRSLRLLVDPEEIPRWR